MLRRIGALGGVAAAALIVGAGTAGAQEETDLRPGPLTPGVLRVCADPDNMPESNQKGEGFENKIAEYIAEKWNSRLEYVWWPVRFGYFGRGLNGGYCDLIVTAPAGLDIAATTKPYFRSTYFFVYRKDSGLNITSLDDPALKRLRIGVNMIGSDGDAAPPAAALKSHGVVGLVGFPTFFSEIHRPEDIINAVADKKIDLAIVWGPVAGYFAAKAPVPLVLHPIPDDSTTGIPFAFSITMATRRKDREFRDSVQTLIDHDRPEIEAILQQYKVPMLPIPADSTTTRTGAIGDTTAAPGKSGHAGAF
ncbi:MAG TPA: quinoprotein dehydrogenase-associated putative ABC transporter substrate-binding protein [Gemmatimonadales bacterium]|nr:quinoprotein dehydrogenase-associated putative ABC transporter substrate-binding protein [Gemmatimonadales bacterium]